MCTSIVMEFVTKKLCQAALLYCTCNANYLRLLCPVAGCKSIFLFHNLQVHRLLNAIRTMNKHNFSLLELGSLDSLQPRAFGSLNA